MNIPKIVPLTADKEGANIQLLPCEFMDVLVKMTAPSPDIGEDKVGRGARQGSGEGAANTTGVSLLTAGVS